MQVTAHEFTDGRGSPIEPQRLSVGRQLYSEADDNDWIVTSVLGEGRFKAIRKDMIDTTTKLSDLLSLMPLLNSGVGLSNS